MLKRTFTSEGIKKMPTLREVILYFGGMTDEFEMCGGWQQINGFPSDMGWNLPMADFYNQADNEKFIVAQTKNKRHTLKPNLRNRIYLYRGQRKDYGSIISSFSQDNLSPEQQELEQKKAWEKHLINNLKAEDFIALLKRHPLFMMLDRGLFLEPEKKPVFINMNYYGLAQHYNFHTGLIDFTSDIDAAAFFACTKNLGNDIYEPITDTSNNPYGVLYVHKIEPMTTFKGIGFSTIGLQLFPRTGCQKGFFFNEIGKTIADVNKLVCPIYFRHEAEVSQHIFDVMKKGEALFPKDSISKYAKEILEGSEVTGETFALNLYSNQEDMAENMEVLRRHGIKVNWHKVMHFTQEMLEEVNLDLKNGLWENFCNQIYFADTKKGRMMHESLLNLPKNPAYKHYFDSKEYTRITAYEADIHRRARENKK